MYISVMVVRPITSRTTMATHRAQRNGFNNKRHLYMLSYINHVLGTCIDGLHALSPQITPRAHASPCIGSQPQSFHAQRSRRPARYNHIHRIHN
jgi:hypothetical protein